MACQVLDGYLPRGSSAGPPLALFTLAVYADSNITLPWLDPALIGFSVNAGLADVYILTATKLAAALSMTGAMPKNVRRLLFPNLIAELLVFAGVHRSLKEYSAKPAMFRPASFTPLLPDFAGSRCELNATIERYAWVGTVELDVVLGRLAPFVEPYFGNPSIDAIGVRWSRYNAPSQLTVQQAIALDSLSAEKYGNPRGVPLSTPLLILRNNATMRRLWWQAEQWLRAMEGDSAHVAAVAGRRTLPPAVHSLRMHVSDPRCSGPSCWFDEHAYPLFWRERLRHARVVYTCCGVDDHHFNEHRDRCIIELSANGLVRRCPSVAEYAWGRRPRQEACGLHSLSDVCATGPRHNAPAKSLAGCQADLGYDRLWHEGTLSVVGSGDSTGALLRFKVTDGERQPTGNETLSVRCSQPVARSIAAFHAAVAKHSWVGGTRAWARASSPCMTLQPVFAGAC